MTPRPRPSLLNYLKFDVTSLFDTWKNTAKLVMQRSGHHRFSCISPGCMCFPTMCWMPEIISCARSLVCVLWAWVSHLYWFYSIYRLTCNLSATNKPLKNVMVVFVEPNSSSSISKFFLFSGHLVWWIHHHFSSTF